MGLSGGLPRSRPVYLGSQKTGCPRPSRIAGANPVVSRRTGRILCHDNRVSEITLLNRSPTSAAHQSTARRVVGALGNADAPECSHSSTPGTPTAFHSKAHCRSVALQVGLSLSALPQLQHAQRQADDSSPQAGRVRDQKSGAAVTTLQTTAAEQLCGQSLRK